jgi:hypothetical protein
MVRPSFIKSLNIDGNNKMTLKDWIIEIFWYNDVMAFFRRIGRFLKRLPKWLKVCWTSETWDFEGIYDYLEMWLKELRKAQEEDTWHTEGCVRKAIRSIDLVLAHLDHYRNWTDYYEWPETKFVESDHLYNGDKTYTMEFVDPDGREKADYVHKMEQKHYEKFWKLLKKYHKDWWT